MPLSAILVTTGVLIGMLFTAQFQASVPLRSSYPFEQHESQRELVKSYLDEHAFLQSRIASLRSELNTIQENQQTGQSDENIALLQELKKEIGLTDISAAGVVIEIDDSKRAKRSDQALNEDMLVHAADLRDVVNALRAVGAAGISINDQRVVLSSSIKGVGNNILVNSTNMLPPFVIAAVGDPDALSSKIALENTLPDIYRRVREVELRFSIARREYVHLPFYTASYPFNFIRGIAD